MTGRQWQLGSVAMVTLTEPHPRRGARPFLMLRDVSGIKDVWRLACTGIVHEDHEVADVHPLVVIDPENPYDAERLWDLIMGRTGIPDLQQALREFADPKPPKPEEPTGLGAVVGDAEGGCWIRVARKSGNVWQRPIGTYRRWDEIDVVRILSPGYDPEATS